MAFNFGATAAAPAGGGGGFSFSGSTATAPASNTAAAPAAGGGFSFGGSAPAAAPAFGAAPAPGGFGFGGAAPAPSAFGGAAPAPSGFGAAPAPQSGFGGFGGAAPAPAAPAQSGFGGFGGAAPAPSGFGSPAPQYQQQQQQQQQQQAAPFAGSTPYADLPPEYKKAIDGLHERMMQHKRSMNNVQSMAPKALLSAVSTAQGAQQQQPPQPPLIKTQIASLDRTIVSLQQELQSLYGRAGKEKTACETSTKQAIMYGKWPVEAIAVRRGVRLHGSSQQQGGEEKKDPDTQTRVRELLDQQLAYVDRVERMPSPYLWEIMDDMKHRLGSLEQQAVMLGRQLDQTRALEITDAGDVVSIVETQCRAIWQVTNKITHVQREMEGLRYKYRMYEREENVLEKAQREESERQRRVDDQIQRTYVQAGQQPSQPGQQMPGQPAAAGLAAPAAGGLFGSTPAPATGGLFGSTPAPAAGGLFGSSPAPAAGGLFGSSPAAAPAAGGLFGIPAPAAGAAAPASAFAFGGSTGTFSSTPKKKSGSRSSGRLKR
jgi:hypothetical protein